MKGMANYFSNFFHALKSLLIGMKTTLKIFFRKKTTERYPEKRGRLHVSERYRGRLEMIHTPDNHHFCVACGICQMNCPNGTLNVESRMETDAQGRKTRVLTAYRYDLGRCLFCELCVRSCPHHAIRFTNAYENAVFTRAKLLLTLNRPGSSLKPKEESPAAPATPDAPSGDAPRTAEAGKTAASPGANPTER